MRVICSSCHIDLGVAEPLSDERLTHGMCADCLIFHTALSGDIRLSEELADSDHPVFVVTPSRRMITCNRRAQQVLGRPLEQLVGLKGGEFLECERSRVEEGCGSGSLCDTCIIRRTIEDTVTTGTPHRNIPAVLHTDRNGRPVARQIAISTEKAGLFIQLKIERLD